MQVEWTVIIGAAISLLSSGLAAFLAYRSTIKRVDADKELIVADAAGKIAEAAKNQIESMQKDLLRLEVKVDLLSKDLGEYKRGTRILIKQLKDMGVTPNWTPPE